jgi:hypothetical protein
MNNCLVVRLKSADCVFFEKSSKKPNTKPTSGRLNINSLPGHYRMTPDYTSFQTDDFVTDTSFSSWVLQPTAETNAFWEAVPGRKSAAA